MLSPLRTPPLRGVEARLRAPIRDFMMPTPVTTGRKQSLSAAHEAMRAHGIRHLPVLEGGRLAGILSQRDALFVESIAGVDPKVVPVEEAMSVDVYSVAPNTPLVEVAAAMADHKYGCAIVSEGEHVVGIFSVVDALRVLVSIAGASLPAR